MVMNPDVLAPVAAGTLESITIGPCRYAPAPGESPGETLIRAVRDWARAIGRPDPTTLEVRNTRVVHCTPDGEYSCSCFVGHRQRDCWTGHYVWVSFTYQPSAPVFTQAASPDVTLPPSSADRPLVEGRTTTASVPAAGRLPRAQQ